MAPSLNDEAKNLVIDATASEPHGVEASNSSTAHAPELLSLKVWTAALNLVCCNLYFSISTASFYLIGFCKMHSRILVKSAVILVIKVTERKRYYNADLLLSSSHHCADKYGVVVSSERGHR